MLGSATTRLREDRDLPGVQCRFRMIDGEGKANVVVPHGDSAARVEDYRRAPDRRTLRGLQPSLVGIPERHLAELTKAGLIETIHEQVHVLRASGPRYDPVFGLIVDRVVPADPPTLILDS